MKYTVSIIIEKPLDQVIALFDDPDNMRKWMDGLKYFEHLEGTPGHPGARSKLVFDMGDREVEMIETITQRDLPDIFEGRYEGSGIVNTVKNKFESIGEGRTKWINEHEFKFSGFMKWVAPLASNILKKQSIKLQKSFREFAENQP